jgi:CRISPR system Cascade subunit CasD
LFLGRKSFPPGEPVYLPDGLREAALEEALLRYPMRPGAEPGRRRMVVEAPPGATNEIRGDVPLSFSNRRYATRHVRTDWKEVAP